MDIDQYILSRAKQLAAEAQAEGREPRYRGKGMTAGSRVGDFLKKVGRFGKTRVGRTLRNIAKKTADRILPYSGMALEAIGAGRRRGSGRPQSDKMKRRGQLVSRLMREEGMTLPQASRFIKENNLMV